MKRFEVNRRRVMLVILAGILLGAALIGAIAFSGTPVLAQSAGDNAGETETNGADDAAEGPDTPITGTALERASAIALEYIIGGRVTGTEVGDEEGYYEIEITRDDGSQVDVHLDEAFNVLGYEED